MTPTTLAETILRDVPRYRLTGYDAGTQPDGAGPYVSHHEVLAALTAALDPAIAERAGEVLPRLRKADEYEPLGHDGWEAADLITALLAQNAALRAERDEARENSDSNFRTAKRYLDRIVAAEAQIAALTARVEGLTEALESIANDVDLMATGRTSLLGKMGRTARAALSATTEEGHA